MLRPAPHIRYHIAAILAAHWIEFVAQYKLWIRPTRHGVLEYWNDGRMGLIGIHLLFLTIPLFQHSNTAVSVPVVENMLPMFGPIRSSIAF